MLLDNAFVNVPIEILHVTSLIKMSTLIWALDYNSDDDNVPQNFWKIALTSNPNYAI